MRHWRRSAGLGCRTARPLVRRWNQTWDYPRLRMAVNIEFFDWTDWRADGLGSGAPPDLEQRGRLPLCGNQTPEYGGQSSTMGKSGTLMWPGCCLADTSVPAVA